MTFGLRLPRWRSSLPVVSARPGGGTALPLACSIAGGLGLAAPLALQGPLLQDQVQAQQARANELSGKRAAVSGRLEAMRARLTYDAEPPQGLHRPPEAPAGRNDRLVLHRLALQHGLRVQALKARSASAAGGAVKPAAARQALAVEFTGSVDAASRYVMALGRSGPAWGLERLEMMAGVQGQHRLVLQLEPLASWPHAAWAPTRAGPPSVSHDPFVAVAPPALPVQPPAEQMVARSLVEPALAGSQQTAPPQTAPPMPAQWQAELDRERQPLEAFALRELVFTGTLRQGSNWLALVRAGGVIHTLRVGDYVGPDLGLVRSVDEEGLDLREIGRDASGQWVQLPRRWRVGVSP